MDSSNLTTIVAINNSISSRMALGALLRDGIQLSECAVLTLRQIAPEGGNRWLLDVGRLLQYPGAPRFSAHEQVRFARYYRRAAAWLRAILETKKVSRIIVVNNDNLLTNHLFRWAESRPGVQLDVVVEGLMNFQDISLRNRVWWRRYPKRLLSAALWLRWAEPRGHLSGAFEPCVNAVYTFCRKGVFAPPDRIIEMPFEAVTAKRPPAPHSALLAMTGLWQWMDDRSAAEFADLFLDWVHRQQFTSLFVKRHPRFDTSFLEKRLPPHQLLDEPRCLEDMAPEFPAEVIISTNCTALVTLRMLRPDLRCIDFGADVYLDRAYSGDKSVLALQRAVGIEMVDAKE